MTGLPLVACPACQTEMGLEALLGTDDARGVVELLARMPGTPALRKAALRYVGLFAPGKQRLRWGRVESLLGELVAMMETGRIERNGRTWAAPLDYWQAAFDAVIGNPNLRRPLKSHGYLLEVLAGQSDRIEAQAEQRVEQTRQGHAGTGGGGERAKRTGMPASIKETIKQFTTQKGAK
jgi:hypothetical protein